jgi:Tfp pilus assembly protein FimT
VDLLRQGQHLKESVIVAGVAASLALLVLPRFSGLAEHNQLTVAREELTTAISTARSAAMQRGRNATLFLSGNRMWVTAEAPNAGATTTVIPVQSFKTLYNVSVAAADPALTQVTFDGRGNATPKLASVGVFRIAGATRKDSVCVTTTGQLFDCE